MNAQTQGKPTNHNLEMTQKQGVMLTPPLDQSALRSWSSPFAVLDRRSNFSVRLPERNELMPSIVALSRASEALNSMTEYLLLHLATRHTVVVFPMPGVPLTRQTRALMLSTCGLNFLHSCPGSSAGASFFFPYHCENLSRVFDFLRIRCPRHLCFPVNSSKARTASDSAAVVSDSSLAKSL